MKGIPRQIRLSLNIVQLWDYEPVLEICGISNLIKVEDIYFWMLDNHFCHEKSNELSLNSIFVMLLLLCFLKLDVFQLKSGLTSLNLIPQQFSFSTNSSNLTGTHQVKKRSTTKYPGQRLLLKIETKRIELQFRTDI